MYVGFACGGEAMKIKGIKRGKTIEILEEIHVPDGQEIIIEISEVQLMSEEETQKGLQEVFGAWKDDAEIAEIFAEIDRERHVDLFSWRYPSD